MEGAPYPWQCKYWNLLQAARRNDRLPHALLLAGIEGSGVGAFARRFAWSLICQQPAASGQPCAGCKNCLLFRSDNYPEVTSVEPAEQGRQIRVNQVRELAAFLQLTCQFGGYKVAIVEPAEAMNLSAANSLLKILEEPPPRTLLMLVSYDTARLPATVRSRCQRMNFALDWAESLAWLQQRTGAARNCARLLSFAYGAPLLALQMAEDGAEQRIEQLFDAMEQLSTGGADPVATAEKLAQGDEKFVLDGLTGMVCQLARSRFTAAPDGGDAGRTMQTWSQRIEPDLAFQLYDQLNKYRKSKAFNANLNFQAFLETFTILWTTGKGSKR